MSVEKFDNQGEKKIKSIKEKLGNGWIKPEIHAHHERTGLITRDGYRVNVDVNKHGHLDVSLGVIGEDGKVMEGTRTHFDLTPEQAEGLAKILPEMVSDARKTAEDKFGSANAYSHYEDSPTAEEVTGLNPFAAEVQEVERANKRNRGVDEMKESE
ncbi:MAG: hypothetical protein WDZ40_02175 [Candidatus Spechtbacterales bacterium]